MKYFTLTNIFLLNFDSENIHRISEHPRGKDFCNAMASRETVETLETLKNL